MIPAAFLPALLMTFPVTLLIRHRISGGLSVTHAVRLPFALPRRLLLRAPAIALVALADQAVQARFKCANLSLDVARFTFLWIWQGGLERLAVLRRRR